MIMRMRRGFRRRFAIFNPAIGARQQRGGEDEEEGAHFLESRKSEGESRKLKRTFGER